MYYRWRESALQKRERERDREKRERESVKDGRSLRPAYSLTADPSQLLSSDNEALYALCLRGEITSARAVQITGWEADLADTPGFTLSEKDGEEEREGRREERNAREPFSSWMILPLLFVDTRFSGRYESERFMRHPAHWPAEIFPLYPRVRRIRKFRKKNPWSRSLRLQSLEIHIFLKFCFNK